MNPAAGNASAPADTEFRDIPIETPVYPMRDGGQRPDPIDPLANNRYRKSAGFPWHYRLRWFVSDALRAIMAGIEDVKREQPKKSRLSRAADIALKILTVAAGIFGLKKL